MTETPKTNGSDEDKVGAVMHNNYMERQLIVSPVGASAELQIAPVTPISTAAAQHLHLGSQDLIRVAEFASNDFELVGFDLADRFLAPLDYEEERNLSGELLEIFDEYDAREVRAALRDDYDGIFVVGIQLRSRASGQRIHLRREGFIDTSVPEEATNLLDRAWRRLRLA